MPLIVDEAVSLASPEAPRTWSLDVPAETFLAVWVDDPEPDVTLTARPAYRDQVELEVRNPGAGEFPCVTLATRQGTRVILELEGIPTSGEVVFRCSESAEGGGDWHSESFIETLNAALGAMQRLRATGEERHQAESSNLLSAAHEIWREASSEVGGSRAHALAGTYLMDVADSAGQPNLVVEVGREVVAWYRDHLPPAHRELIDVEFRLGYGLLDVGLAEQAREVLAPLLEVLEEWGDLVTLAQGLQALGMAEKDLGHLLEAEDLERRAIALLRSSSDVEPPRLAVALGNLANTLAAAGDLEGEARLIAAAIALMEGALGDDDPLVHSSRLALATNRADIGDPDLAMALALPALEGLCRHLGPDHFQTLQGRMVLGDAMVNTGDLLGAEQQFRLALQVLERIVEPSSKDLLHCRASLAYVLENQERYEEAYEVSLQALDSVAAADGQPAAQCSRALHHHSLILHRLGRDEEARQIQEEELRRRVERFGESSAQACSVRNNLALTLTRIGEVHRAHQMHLENLSIRQQGLAPGNELRAISLANAIRAALIMDEPAKARRLAMLADAEIGAEVIERMTLSDGARQLRARLESRSDLFDMLLSATTAPSSGGENGVELTSLAAELVTLHRGAPAASARLRVLSTREPRVSKALRTVENAQRELEQQWDSGDTADRAGALLARDRAERELSLILTPESRVAVQPPAAAAIRAACPGGSLLVSYRAFHRVLPGGQGDGDHLIAFTHDAIETRLVDLGPLSSIEPIVSEWVSSVQGLRGEGRSSRGTVVAGPRSQGGEGLGARLRAKVLDPILGDRGDVRRLVIVPDGPLYQIPLDALPLGEGLVGDRYQVMLVGSLWDLILPSSPFRDEDILLVVGDIDYGPAPGFAGQQRIFKALSETAGEIAAVETEFVRARGEDATVRRLTRGHATVRALQDAVKGATHVHLATHGYGSVRIEREDQAEASSSARSRSLREFVPLNACGLALSGANERDIALPWGDGILTGDEVSLLDLSSCRLAVLSACETSVGDAPPGQLGATLRQALHLAGATTTITALWEVSDKATAALMGDFYRLHFVDGLTVPDALWKARMKARKEGALVTDWAGWIVGGSRL